MAAGGTVWSQPPALDGDAIVISYTLTLDEVEDMLLNRAECASLNAELAREWRASPDYPFRNQMGRPRNLQEHVSWHVEHFGKSRV